MEHGTVEGYPIVTTLPLSLAMEQQVVHDKTGKHTSPHSMHCTSSRVEVANEIKAPNLALAQGIQCCSTNSSSTVLGRIAHATAFRCV